jgi:hypothetical protein
MKLKKYFYWKKNWDWLILFLGTTPNLSKILEFILQKGKSSVKSTLNPWILAPLKKRFIFVKICEIISNRLFLNFLDKFTISKN